MTQVFNSIADVFEFDKSLDTGEDYKLADDTLIVYIGDQIRCTLPVVMTEQVWLYFVAKNKLL